MQKLPDWVNSENLLMCGKTLFVPNKAQVPKPGKKKATLVVAGNGETFNLNKVKLAQATDIPKAEVYIAPSGLAIHIRQTAPTEVVLSSADDDAQAVLVRLPQEQVEFDSAVSSFSKFFNGKLAEDPNT